jgi:hypothetical protein
MGTGSCSRVPVTSLTQTLRLNAAITTVATRDTRFIADIERSPDAFKNGL